MRRITLPPPKLLLDRAFRVFDFAEIKIKQHTNTPHIPSQIILCCVICYTRQCEWHSTNLWPECKYEDNKTAQEWFLEVKEYFTMDSECIKRWAPYTFFVSFMTNHNDANIYDIFAYKSKAKLRISINISCSSATGAM